MEIEYTNDHAGVDWAALKAALLADDFDNGRTPDQLRRSFENSFAVAFARHGDRVVGKARAISDGVGNAYIVDVWTQAEFRGRGIAREMVRRVLNRLPGQHVYLQADDEHVGLYEKFGFRRQPNGMSIIVGRYLDETPITE